MTGVSQRMIALEESATVAITARAKAMRAGGAHVIGYGAGEPDFPTPPAIVEAARQAALDPDNHRYTPTAGLPKLRAAIAAKTERDSGLVVAPSQVVVTNGAKQAVYATCQVLLDPGDEVLLPTPYWVTYPEAVRLAGGVPVPVPSDHSASYRVTVDQLEAATTDRTKLLIHVSPSNPTGAVYPADEVEAIGRWAADRGTWVMTDEIYEHLTYGVEAPSMPVVVPEMADRCVVVNGVAKTYAMTGWRVGWLIGPPQIAEAATTLQSHLTSNVANVTQAAAHAAVSGPLDAVAKMRAAFDRRRRTMHRMLNEIPGVRCPEPLGAFYAFPSVGDLLGRRMGMSTPHTSLELAAVLLDEIEIAVIPGEAFGAPGHLRLSYALADDELIEGLTRFQDLITRSG
ncbi:MAG: pyridoxal phosphate-dependent aminotransferase [Acidimicrobiia bacterium]